MPITDQSPAPYAPGAAVLNVLTRYREKGLTMPITQDVLIRAGVTESLASRTFQSLQGLDLITDEGMPTELMQKLRAVPEKEYKAALADWIKAVYEDVFKFVDPATDDAVAVRDAFRAYQPHGQQDRMVALFLSLCVAAGLAQENTAKSAPKSPTRKAKEAARMTARPKVKGPSDTSVESHSSGLPPALRGLLASLPQGGAGWTQEKRDKFVETFKHVLDFCIPVIEEEKDDLSMEREE